MKWENVPGITPERVMSAWVTTELDPGPMWPWLDRWIRARREARRIRKADAAAKTIEHDGPYPTLPDPMRRPEYR